MSTSGLSLILWTPEQPALPSGALDWARGPHQFSPGKWWTGTQLQIECIQGPGLAQNWKNKIRHTQIDPYNWEAIKAHFLWTCHSIPQVAEDDEDHPDIDRGDDLN